MYSPYRRWNGCLGGLFAFAVMAFLMFSWASGARGLVLLLAAVCFLLAIIGIVRLAFSSPPGQSRLSTLPVIAIAIGSIMASIGIMFVVGGAAEVGRLTAMSGVALAIIGFFFDELSRRR
ncbi:MAG: hypothetical protein ACLFWF_13785 [Alphaproteobacteria bacterium]